MDPRQADRRQFMTPTPVLDAWPATAPMPRVTAAPERTELQRHLDELRVELAAERRLVAEVAAGLGQLAARVDAALTAAEVDA